MTKGIDEPRLRNQNFRNLGRSYSKLVNKSSKLEFQTQTLRIKKYQPLISRILKTLSTQNCQLQNPQNSNRQHCQTRNVNIFWMLTVFISKVRSLKLLNFGTFAQDFWKVMNFRIFKEIPLSMSSSKHASTLQLPVLGSIIHPSGTK